MYAKHREKNLIKAYGPLETLKSGVMGYFLLCQASRWPSELMSICMHPNSEDRFASNATHMAALYWGLLLLGRFLGSFIKQVPSEKQLVIASIGAIVLLVLAMLTAESLDIDIDRLFSFHHVAGHFAHLATDQLGKYATKASGVLTMGVIGGGIIPLLHGIFCRCDGWQLALDMVAGHRRRSLHFVLWPKWIQTTLNSMINFIKRYSAPFTPDSFVSIPYSTGDHHVHFGPMRQLQ